MGQRLGRWVQLPYTPLLRGIIIRAESLLASHAILGLLGTLAAMWALVELLAGGGDRRRASAASLAAGVFIWLSFLAGGRWYVSYYGADKALILAGPKPWVHSVIMETKEHLFFALLLLSTYLPIVVHHPDLATSKSTRTLAGAIAGLSVLLGLTMLLLGTLVGLAARAGTG